MKYLRAALMTLIVLTSVGAAALAQPVPLAGGYRQRSASTREVKVYLVALNDDGRTGAKIGCDDSLVPVTRTIKATGAPLKAALQELLSVPREYEGRLSNSWWGRNLRVKTVSLRAGVATIRITGELFVAGVCDIPRIEAQIKETARQFPSVRKVKVFVNDLTLAQAIR